MVPRRGKNYATFAAINMHGQMALCHFFELIATTNPWRITYQQTLKPVSKTVISHWTAADERTVTFVSRAVRRPAQRK